MTNLLGLDAAVRVLSKELETADKKIEQYEQYIEYCDDKIMEGLVPLHFVQWREANSLPHL